MPADGDRALDLLRLPCHMSIDDTALDERMAAISDSFETYGYRRMQAALRQQGFVVNPKSSGA